MSDLENKSVDASKPSEYWKRLRSLRKLYEAVDTYARTDENFYLKTHIKLLGCELNLKHLTEYIYKKNFEMFDKEYYFALMFLNECLEAYVKITMQQLQRRFK